MKKALWPALAGVVLLVTVVYGWYYFPRGGRPSPEQLQQQALSAATPQEQQAAAAQLCDWGEAAVPQMRNVLQSSKEPAIKAMMIQSLGAMFDYDSMDLLLAGLSDESVMVREKSVQAVRSMLGRTIPYDPHGPEGERTKAIAWMRKDWDELKNSPLLADFKQRQQSGAIAPPSSP